MPTTQPKYGWPLPLDTDPLSGGAKAIRDLANGVAGSFDSPVWASGWSSADQTLGADGWSQVTLGNENDPFGVFAASAFTCPYAGILSADWAATIGLSGAAPGAVNISSALYVNGAEYRRGSSYATSSSPALQSLGSVGSSLVQAVAGTVLTLWVFVQVPGTTKKVLATGTRLDVNYNVPRPV